MKPKITIAYGEDWEAIYVDDMKITEGHSISKTTILEALGFEVIEIECDKQMNELGHAPDFAPDILPDL